MLVALIDDAETAGCEDMATISLSRLNEARVLVGLEEIEDEFADDEEEDDEFADDEEEDDEFADDVDPGTLFS